MHHLRHVFSISLPSTHDSAGDEVTGPKEKYIAVPVGTLGGIVDGNDKLNHPGLVRIRVKGETLYTFARDLHENVFIDSLAYGAFE